MNPTHHRISLPVIKRLPRYYRYVQSLADDGVTTVSSSELAAALGTTASQVRQDFSCLGAFGQQGVGYSVALLCAKLNTLLFSGPKLNTVVIGAGRLGRTISQFLSREAPGFALIAAFDNDPAQIGTTLGGVQVRDMATLPAFCAEAKPQICVLCVPEESTAGLVPALIEYGFKGFWNFSHYDLTANHPGITVENVHLGDSLSSLGYRVRNLEEN